MRHGWCVDRGLRWEMAALALLLLLVLPAAACATSVSWPVAGPARVVVTFGASYEVADGRQATHRGADLEAEPCQAVLSPCVGLVTFAGRVPATDGSGTQLAVTIESAEGVRFTLMPLASAETSAGARVQAGAVIGTAAERGDGSSPVAHLHVGARRGDLYVDPLPLLGVTAVSSEAGGPGEDLAGQDIGQAASASAAAAVSSGPAALVSAHASGEAASLSAATQDAVAGQALAPGVANVPVATSEPGAESAPAEQGLAGAAPGAWFTAFKVGQSSWHAPSVAGTNGGAASSPGGRSLLADMLASLASRGVPSALGSLNRLLRAWLVAAIALLAATGALWPLWRHTPSVGEPCPRVAPVGSEIAAAAGR
jgi:hypothetical protein